jgi:hypothetical protein
MKKILCASDNEGPRWARAAGRPQRQNWRRGGVSPLPYCPDDAIHLQSCFYVSPFAQLAPETASKFKARLEFRTPPDKVSTCFGTFGSKRS